MLRSLAGLFTGCTVANLIFKHSHADGTLLPVFTIPVSIVLTLSVTVLATSFYGYGLIIYPVSALLITGILLTRDNIFKRYL